MAVTNQSSAQISSDRLYPVENHGKLRIAYFSHTQVTAAGDTLSTVNLVRLPYGRIRIFPQLSLFAFSAFGAARVMDIGHRAYVGESAVDVAESLNALANDIDVSAADANGVPIGNLVKWDMFSRKGMIMAAQVAGGTWPLGAVISGYFTYVHE